MTEELVSDILTRIQESIDKKDGLFHTLAVQSTDIFENFRKQDFDATIAELEVLFESQETDLKAIERRNKIRIPNPNLNLDHLCRLIIKVARLREKGKFEIGVASDYNEITKQIANFAKAEKEGKPTLQKTAGTSIKVLFRKFLENELGFQVIAELCTEALEEIRQQKAWINGITDPSSIFEQLRRQKMEGIMEVEKLPQDQKTKIKRNSQTMGMLPDSIKRERAILERLKETALKYFPKSDLLNAALLKMYGT